MKIPITSHPIATEIDIHDGSLRLEFTLLAADGSPVGKRNSASVGIADEYVGRKLAEMLGFETEGKAALTATLTAEAARLSEELTAVQSKLATISAEAVKP